MRVMRSSGPDLWKLRYLSFPEEVSIETGVILLTEVAKGKEVTLPSNLIMVIKYYQKGTFLDNKRSKVKNE